MERPVRTIQEQHEDIEAWFSRVSDPESDRRVALLELVKRVAAHVSVEQSVFLPVIRSAGATGRELERGLKRDYRRLGGLLIRIERRKANSPDLPRMVTDLEGIFRRHVQRCEALSDIEAGLPANTLEDVSARLQRAESVILSHPHPHLLSLGPLSRLTTRLAARLDWARDRTVSNLP
jgi:hypothetical protein